MIQKTASNTRDGAFELNAGGHIPAIGFGTWKSKPEDAYISVKTALQVGYRHIDTAFVSPPTLLSLPHRTPEIGKTKVPVEIPYTEADIILELWQ